MRICQTNPLAVEGVRLNHSPYLVQVGDLNLRQSIKPGNGIAPVGQASENELGNDEWVDRNVVSLQLPDESGLPFPKMVHPYGRIGKNHLSFAFAAFACQSLLEK